MPLFSGIQYSMLDIDQSLSEEIKQLLEENDAKEIPIVPENRVNLDQCTHIISSHVDFLDFEEAVGRSIFVVTPEWVKISSKKKTIQAATMYSADPKMIFSGLTVSCSEIPPGDRDAIYGGICALGGQFCDNLTRSVTYIFALNDKSEKCQQAMSRANLNIKIVLPHWFDMCLKLRRRIDPTPYLFPDPPIFNVMENSDKGKAPLSGGEKYTHPIDTEKPPPKPIQLSFEGKKFFFGGDLKLGNRVIDTLKAVIMNVGGWTVERLEDATIYIGAYRKGEEYASRKNLVVGNLTWLYWMCANDKWTSPLKYLLHYPLVQGGIPGMQDFVITVTNYTGEARTYLEKLIQACGARYTRNMKPENTHLIAANETGEKYKVAKDWNINIVNHMWLEESYATWSVRALTDTQFTTFPQQSNLMQIINSTGIDPECLVQFYEEEEETGEETEGQEEGDKIQGSTAPNGSANGSANDSANGSANTCTKSNNPTSAVQSIKKKQPRLSTPISDPQDEKLSTGKRKAASAAQTRLSETIMPDMNAFEKERKRKTMADPPETLKRKPIKKRNHEDGGTNKKAKLTLEFNGKGDGIRLMHTGFQDTTGKSIRVLESMGVEIVDEPDECTHLAAPGVLRTEKFLRTFPFVDVLVSTRWIEACVSSKAIIDPIKYPLEDSEGEAKYQCNLEESRSRADKNGATLFKDYTIVATNSIKGGVAPLCGIVNANGGKAISVASLKGKGGNFGKTQPVLITTSNEEQKYKDKFLKAAHKEGKTGAVYGSEWILRSVLRQEIVDGSGYIIT
ncbi:BRCT-containing protein 1 [Neolecta irregularis DAH-3]|uniref:BRCT-containing protein 1 n=1 Tax=Neolecta irregularis (strain DAH-3) TaxID=1198029 RepID=A0A1U7LPL5_NEOID|nr:BRCT-containing protein 1 [Neolecta irregularis DAH-3]|eukprot:OLL24568.1 BRCT-containing protein 1 [Neolecta irregularis DAH-3]